MKRTLMLVLMGTAFLVPIDAEAQRTRNRNRGGVRQAPVASSGRLANCRTPARGQAFDCRSRVVYSSYDRYDNRRWNAGRRDGLWIRADWRGVRLFASGRHARRAVLNQGRLRDVLGRRTVERLRDVGHDAGLRGRLAGRWENARGRGSVLIVTMGRVEIAEFIDFDRDGYVDEMFLARGTNRRRTVSRW
jgi:hypothetical protein